MSSPLAHASSLERRQNFDSYRMELHNAVSALLEKVISAASAARCILREVFMTEVSVCNTKEIVKNQESVAGSVDL